MGRNAFYHKDNLTIINEDVFATHAIPAKGIDLVVTSPPYNVDIRYNSHDDKLTYA